MVFEPVTKYIPVVDEYDRDGNETHSMICYAAMDVDIAFNTIRREAQLAVTEENSFACHNSRFVLEEDHDEKAILVNEIAMDRFGIEQEPKPIYIFYLEEIKVY